MLNTEQLHELRGQAERVLKKSCLHFVDIDPRVLIELVDVAEESMRAKFKETLKDTLPELVGVPVVFWTCRDHPGGTVTWEHLRGPSGSTLSIATCDQCGRTNQ